MYRIFISHSSAELREAKALQDWLIQQDPPLANEIFLDADRLRPGLQWRDQLRQAVKSCEAVVRAFSLLRASCGSEPTAAQRLPTVIPPIIA